MNRWEQHLQTVLISVITGALVFAANYFYTDNREKAGTKTQLDILTNQVVEMRADIRALRDTYVKRDELKELEQRVRDIEMRRK